MDGREPWSASCRPASPSSGSAVDFLMPVRPDSRADAGHLRPRQLLCDRAAARRRSRSSKHSARCAASSRELEREFPQRNARRTVMMLSLQEQMVGELRPAIFRAARRGDARAARGLRQRRQPAPRAQRRSRARARHAHGAWRAARTPGAPDARPRAWCSRRPAASAGLAVAALCHRGLLLRWSATAFRYRGSNRLTLDSPVVAFTMAGRAGHGDAVRRSCRRSSSTSTRNDALREGGRHSAKPQAAPGTAHPGGRRSRALAGAARRRRTSACAAS